MGLQRDSKFLGKIIQNHNFRYSIKILLFKAVNKKMLDNEKAINLLSNVQNLTTKVITNEVNAISLEYENKVLVLQCHVKVLSL